MPYIAEDPVRVEIRTKVPALHDTQGRMVAPEQRNVYAKFHRGLAPEWAQKIAVETFDFSKLHEGDVTAERWFGYYDPEDDRRLRGWTDEEVAAIKEKLSRIEGVHEVHRPRLPAPYRLYDKHRKVQGRRLLEHALSDITAAVTAAGVDPAEVIAYERENENSPEIIQAMEYLLGETQPVDDDGPLVAA